MKHAFSAFRRYLPYLLIVAAGCGDGSGPPPPVASVSLNLTSATLVPGASTTLIATPLGTDAKPLVRPVIWATSDASVATVAAGVVTAVAPGKANITASSTGVVASAAITVKEGGVILPTGAAIQALGGAVTISAPAGAVASGVQLVVEPATDPTTSARLVPGTAFSLDAGTASLNQPVTISIKYDQSSLHQGASESGLKLYELASGKWQRILTSSVNPVTDQVTATTSSLGVFGVLEQAPAIASINGGNNQVAEVATSVTTPPSIKVVDSEGFPVAGVSVQFTVTTGNGALTGATVATNGDGIATLGSWKLGTIAGSNSLTASVTGASGGPFTFTATGVAAAPSKLVFTTAPPESVRSGVTWVTQPAVRLVDVYGNVATLAGTPVTVSIAAGGGVLGGTRTVNTSATGIAAFTDLVLSGSAGAKTITFVSGSLTALNSSLTVTAGLPRTITASAGDNQTAIAGSAVATPPTVRVVDAEENPVQGVAVTFAVATGGGSVSGAVTSTDALGIAKVGSWTLGQTAGQNTLTATSAGLVGSPVTFSATGGAGAAGRLAFVTLPSASPGSRIVFPQQPVVQLQDASGNAVSQAGIIVTVSIASGGGTLSGTLTQTTNAQGQAAFTDLALSGSAGPRTLNFATPGITPVSSTVTLGAGNPSAIASNGGNAQTARAGTAVFTPPSVLVTDADGNRVQGVSVVFSPAAGSGSVSGGTAITDAFGIATVGSWTLGTTVGTHTLSATTAALPSQAVSFTATSTPGDPIEIVLIRGNAQSAPAGRGIAEAILFRVFDAFGNGVPNTQVNFVVTSGNGTVSPSTATTLSTGVAVMTGWTLGSGTGNQTVTATVSGLQTSSAIVTATAVTVRIVTFGDSNTDYGYIGNNPAIDATSYVSANPDRQSPTTPNKPSQLAGKIELKWGASVSSAISAVNHGVMGTSTGAQRSTAGAPGAFTVVNGVTRFAGEVLGSGFPWSGGEPTNSSFPQGSISRVRAFVPTVNDFVYVSIGTNDPVHLIQPHETIANITAMVDAWIDRGLPASHFILTNLAPAPGANESQVKINRDLRQLVVQKGISLIDLTAHTSNDDGLTWKSSSLHVGDSIHYAESVRDWLATEVVSIMTRVTAAITQ